MSGSIEPILGAHKRRSVEQTSSLRELLDARRQEGRSFSLSEAIDLVVPLCLDLKERHARGELCFVHPSAISVDSYGAAKFDPSRSAPPTHARDRAAVPTEVSATPGNARASVFSVGAILYEAITGSVVGPGMLKTRDLDDALPEALDVLLAKALVANAQHRPDDLGALASALHQLGPSKSIAPPAVNISILDKGADFEVDIQMSLMPPRAPSRPSIPTPPPGTLVDATTQLAQLKERLESDPRPRYVVSKDRMDHGPFTAVELLQQIASSSFRGEHDLRDEVTGETRKIAERAEFAPFAEHAQIHRERDHEKKEVVRLDSAEKKAGWAKSVGGVAIIVGLVGAGVFWFVQYRGARSDSQDLIDDPSALGLDIDGGLSGGRRAGGRRAGGGSGGGGGGGGGGGFAPGMSYEAALNAGSELTIGAGGGGADLSNGQLNAPMGNNGWLEACGAKDSMKVTAKVAVKGGRAVGVTVYTQPSSPSVASCVDRHIRGLSWANSSKLDSFTTVY